MHKYDYDAISALSGTLTKNAISNGLIMRHHFNVGSAKILGEGNDIDLVVTFKKGFGEPYLSCTSDEITKFLETQEFFPCIEELYSGEDSTNSPFRAFRRGAFNLIVVDSDKALDHWQAATQACVAIVKEFGTISKEMRILIHQIIRRKKVISPDNPFEAFAME